MKATCNNCGKSEDVPITNQQIAAYKAGELIQRVAPNLTDDQREILISGICGKCFDDMFSDEEDESEYYEYSEGAF